MDGVTGLTRVYGTTQGHERKGGKQDAEAFDQAMQDQQDGTAAEREPEPPVRRALQREPSNGRKQHVEAHHIDVVA